MEKRIVGIKELHKRLSEISDLVGRGYSFLVVKNSRPAFSIEPIREEIRRKYSLKDFDKIRFKSGDKNLSKKIDRIIYGV